MSSQEFIHQINVRIWLICYRNNSNIQISHILPHIMVWEKNLFLQWLLHASCLLYHQSSWVTAYSMCIKECVSITLAELPQFGDPTLAAPWIHEHTFSHIETVQEDWSLGYWLLSEGCKGLKVAWCPSTVFLWLEVFRPLAFPHWWIPSYQTQVLLWPHS